MSCCYADGLSPYEHKGKLGLEETFDSKEEVLRKVNLLSDWLKNAQHVVVHTGAGISTSAGIPDFRGPNGVWTLEAQGKKPAINISFNDAVPTKTHMALAKLVEVGMVQYIVSQNIDGLHLRSGIPRTHIAELHGNMFTELCHNCNRQFVRNEAASTVGQRSLHEMCLVDRRNGRPCRGILHDTILDWDHDLPKNDILMADFHSCVADLSICLGTTLQIIPSGNLPVYTKKRGGKLIICNLQPTKHDRKADLLIHAYVDDIMVEMMKLLNLEIPEYKIEEDPCKTVCRGVKCIDWTIDYKDVKKMQQRFEAHCVKSTKKRKISDDTSVTEKMEEEEVGAATSDQTEKVKEEEKVGAATSDQTDVKSETFSQSQNFKTENENPQPDLSQLNESGIEETKPPCIEKDTSSVEG